MPHIQHSRSMAESRTPCPLPPVSSLVQVADIGPFEARSVIEPTDSLQSSEGNATKSCRARPAEAVKLIKLKAKTLRYSTSYEQRLRFETQKSRENHVSSLLSTQLADQHAHIRYLQSSMSRNMGDQPRSYATSARPYSPEAARFRSYPSKTIPGISSTSPIHHQQQRPHDIHVPLRDIAREVVQPAHSIFNVESSRKEWTIYQDHLYRYRTVQSLWSRYICAVCHETSRPTRPQARHPSHKSERPFKCTRPGCDIRFTSHSSMIRHIRGCKAIEAAANGGV